MVRPSLMVTLVLVLAACTPASEAATTSAQPAEPTTPLRTEVVSDPATALEPIVAPTTVLQPTPTAPTTSSAPSTTAVETTSSAVVEPVAETAEGGAVDPIFDPITDALRAETTVSIALPEQLAGIPKESDPAVPLLATLADVSADAHRVVIGHGPCDGGDACRIQTISARRVARNDAISILGAGIPVPLPDGRTGSYLPAECAPICGDASITWLDADGTSRDILVARTVTHRSGRASDALAVAWSVLSRGSAPEAPAVCGFETVARDGAVAAVQTIRLSDGRELHWLTACSDDGIATELLAGRADLRWLDDTEPMLETRDQTSGIATRHHYDGSRLHRR